MFRREVQLAQFVLTAAKYVTKNTAQLYKARSSVLQALAAQIAQLPTSSRRLLQAPFVLGRGGKGEERGGIEPNGRCCSPWATAFLPPD